MGGIFFSRLFVSLGAIICLVKTAAFEKHPGPTRNDSSDLTLATGRAFADRLVLHRLEFLELMPALIAFVTVSRHWVFLLWKGVL